MGIKRALFLEADGFDEALPALEDVDFCWRLQLAGTKLHFVPEAEIHYRLRSDLSGILRQAISYSEHQVMIYRKFREHGLQRPPLTIRAFLKGPDGIASLLKRLPASLTRREKFGAWLWHCGWRMGKFKGSLKHRYLVA